MWASIVKKNAGTAAASTSHEKVKEKKIFGGAAIIPKMEDPVLDGTSADDYPRYRYLTRPDAPTVEPFFESESDFFQWYREYYKMNEEFSMEIQKKLAAEWRKKNRWHDVPVMTEMTREQEIMGFFPLMFGIWDLARIRMRMKEDPTFQPPIQFGYMVPQNSTERRVNFLAFLLKMLHNRADELIQCKTVGDFEKVYLEAYILEDGEAPPSAWNESNLHSWRKTLERKKKTVRHALWALSVKANLFPGRQVQACNLASNPRRLETVCDDRGEVGICGVKDIKTLGNDAPIRWYLSPSEMRNIHRFSWKFENDPESGYSSDDCY